MEKVSWFKLMWSNSYIQLFAVGLIGSILMLHYRDRFESFNEWAIGESIFVLMCLAIAYFGFYKFWKTYNEEADRINANKKKREADLIKKDIDVNLGLCGKAVTTPIKEEILDEPIETTNDVAPIESNLRKANNISGFIIICSFHQEYQVALINQWCPYCGRVIQEPMIVEVTEELKQREQLFNQHCADYVDALTKVSYYASLPRVPEGIDMYDLKRKVGNYQFGLKAEAEHRQ